jgi:putative redox protein
VVESQPLREAYGVQFRAREHEGRADTIKGGVGGNSGMRPHELLEAALASCMTITARMVADELGVSADGVRVFVELERAERTSTFRYELQLPANLSEEQIETMRARVANSPVRRTLSADLRFEPAPITASMEGPVVGPS